MFSTYNNFVFILIQLITYVPFTMGNTFVSTLPSPTKQESTLSNQRWILKQHPKGKLDMARDTDFVTETMDLSTVSDDELVIEVQALSVDAFVRTMLDEVSNAAHGSTGVGKTIPALGYGKVIKGNKDYK